MAVVTVDETPYAQLRLSGHSVDGAPQPSALHVERLRIGGSRPRTASGTSLDSRGERSSRTISPLGKLVQRTIAAHQMLVESVWMDRYGMACAWLCFVQTTVQLLSSSLHWSANSSLNIAFNTTYAVAYAGFLYAYAWMTEKPKCAYTLGVVLYTFGYVAFIPVYVSGQEPASVTEFYMAGSAFFLVGSLFLMHATVPRKTDVGPPTFDLFSGSTTFMLGSVLFELDAMGYSVPDGFPHGLSLSITGYVLFVIGRVFFIYGSQTCLCDLFFRRHSSELDVVVASPPSNWLTSRGCLHDGGALS